MRSETRTTRQYKFYVSSLPFSIAIDLINNLLQVKLRKRFSVDKSLSHVYLQVTLHTCTEGAGLLESRTGLKKSEMARKQEK